MAEPQRQAFSAPRGKLYINEILVGWVTSVRGSETITQFPVRELGAIDPVEITPVDRSVEFTCGLVRIPGESLQQMGIWPRGETLDVINWPAMSMVLYDQKFDKALYRIEGAKPQTRDFTLDLGTVMMKNASFLALRLFDEQEA